MGKGGVGGAGLHLSFMCFLQTRMSLAAAGPWCRVALGGPPHSILVAPEVSVELETGYTLNLLFNFPIIKTKLPLFVNSLDTFEF